MYWAIFVDSWHIILSSTYINENIIRYIPYYSPSKSHCLYCSFPDRYKVKLYKITQKTVSIFCRQLLFNFDVSDAADEEVVAGPKEFNSPVELLRASPGQFIIFN